MDRKEAPYGTMESTCDLGRFTGPVVLTGGDAATALYSGDLVNVLKKALAERA